MMKRISKRASDHWQRRNALEHYFSNSLGSFKNSSENREYLIDHRRFREYLLVLEVRHASWTEPEILDLLAELGMGLCKIDQPLFKRSTKPRSEVTSSISYVRLHDRNYKTWFSETATVRDRYDFLYSKINWSRGSLREGDRAE